MRRLLLVAGALAIAGCSDFRELFSAQADTAAEAESLELPPERLAQILTGPKGVRLNNDAARFVTNMWVDYALFAQAVAARELPSDSSAIAEALWPDIAQIRSDRWHDTLVSRRTSFSPQAMDSIYNSDVFRIFQHLLVSVPQTATPEERTVARSKVEGALAQYRRGTAFAQLAARLSQDPQSAQDSGYLPPSARGQYVTAFDSAGWSLAPGGVSSVVETPFGYHLIRRPAARELGGRLQQAAQLIVTQRLDSLYFDSLGRQRDLKIRPNAPGTMREALDDREKARDSKKTLATYRGGELTVREFLRWVEQIPPQYQQQLATLPDSQMSLYARTIAQNMLLLAEADSAKIALTPVEWQSLRQQYLAQVDSLKMDMALGSDVADSSVAESQRRQMAEMKVQSYFDRLIAGQVRLRRIPATLSQVLRDRMEWRVNEGGVERGLQLAQRTQAAGDSASGAGAMRPAPGPAPGQVPMGPGGLQQQTPHPQPPAQQSPRTPAPQQAPAQ